MKKLFLLLLITQTSPVFAQTDTVLAQKLTQPVQSCDVVAFNSQTRIANFHLHQWDSILPILSIWADYCGNNEPIQRLKMLYDIEKGLFQSAQYNEYVANYIEIYKYRVADAKETDYKKRYDYNQKYYDYIPLNGRFDAFTQKIAADLLPKQTQDSAAHLFCTLFANDIAAFNTNADKKVYKTTLLYQNKQEAQNRSDFTGPIHINLGLGAWYPIGQMSKIFQPAPYVNAGFSADIKPHLHCNFGIIVAVATNPKEVYIDLGSTPQTTPTNSLIGMNIVITKEVPLPKKFSFEIQGGGGLAMMSTNIQKPNAAQVNTQNNNESRYYTIETLDLTGGIGIRRAVNERNSVGVSLNYHFVPYNLDSKLITNIGNQYATMIMSYRF